MGIWLGAPVPQVLAPLLGVTLVSTDIRFFPENLPNSVSVLGININEFMDVTGMLGFDFTIPMRIEPPTPFLREKFFIEFGAALFYVNFDAGFNPVEFVDFLLGWTTLDITGDD